MTPIATIITNNTQTDRFVSWTGATKTWLTAGSSVEVPFEVWSVGDKKQHEALTAELRGGLVSLALKILRPSGEYETIPYNPIAQLLPQAPVRQLPEVKPSPTASKTEETVHSNKHIVIAGDKGMSDVAKHFHLKAEAIVQPGEKSVEDDIKDTVVFSNKVLQEDRIVEEKQEETPVEPEELIKEAEVLEDESPAEEEKSKEQLAKEINELLSAKAYEEAYKILVEVYGAEKITFKASALSRLKNFEAIVKKYKLDE